jgi:hypothetical protein
MGIAHGCVSPVITDKTIYCKKLVLGNRLPFSAFPVFYVPFFQEVCLNGLGGRNLRPPPVSHLRVRQKILYSFQVFPGIWHRGFTTWHKSSATWQEGSATWQKGSATWHKGPDTWHKGSATWQESSATWQKGSATWHKSSATWHRRFAR